LGSIVLKHILKVTSTVPDDVIIGQALTAGQGQNPARQTALNSGCPLTTTATSINMLCGSGLKACVMGCQAIKCGDSKIVVCGGQESMSQAPHCLHLRNGYKMNDTTMTDTMIKDGLTDAFNNIHMGITAENVAKLCLIPREAQDLLAYTTQTKYQEALKTKQFINEIVPVEIQKNKTNILITEDEHPRANTSLTSLANLKPCFQKDGTVTAGNASGINDGAALLMLCKASEAKSRNLTPLVRIVSYAQYGCDPIYMGIAPIETIKIVLDKAGWSTEDVDLFEINEAFASQSVAIVEDLKLNKSQVNVNGGSIAIGHPIGASGARILVTLIHSLINSGKKKGLAALCIGGGMGIAMCVEVP
jgi:acetyl-CoA C-acetyltransferase